MATPRKTAAPKAAPQGEEKKQPETAKEREARLRRESYSAAQSRLREEYRDRFRQLVKQEAAQRGVTYEFAPTKAERAKEQIQALLAEHPELRDQLVEPVSAPEAADAPDISAEPAPVGE